MDTLKTEGIRFFGAKKHPRKGGVGAGKEDTREEDLAGGEKNQ